MTINEKELLELTNKVSACNKTPTVVIYEYLPKEEKDAVRIENEKEIWRGIEVVRLGDINNDLVYNNESIYLLSKEHVTK